MNIKPVGPNQTEVTKTNGTRVFFSYETPVAVQLKNGTYWRTDDKFSATTTRHINKWLDGVTATVVTQTKIAKIAS